MSRDPMRWLRHTLAGPAAHHPDGVFATQRCRFDQTWLLIRVFYAVSVSLLLRVLTRWNGWLEVEAFDPLWPLAWARDFAPGTVASLLVVLFVVGWLAVQLVPHRRLARLAFALGLFLVVAFDNSFGKIDHDRHLWVYVALLLVALPEGRETDLARSRVARQKTLLVFAGAQALFLASYTLAGLWKVVGGFEQMAQGRIGLLSPEAFSYLTADRLLQTGSDSVFGPLVIEHVALGWPLLLGGIYLELFSLFVLYRPALWRLWGLGIVGIHAGSVLILTVNSPWNCLLAMLLFVAAPTATYGWRDTLASLPPWISRRRRLGRGPG